MRTWQTRMVAVLAALVPVAPALQAVAETTEGPSGPAIHQVEPATEARGAEVKVIRGSVADVAPPAPAWSSKMIPGDGVEAVAGDRLWLVDRKAGRVTGCYLSATIRAGGLHDIRCVTRRLP